MKVDRGRETTSFQGFKTVASATVRSRFDACVFNQRKTLVFLPGAVGQNKKAGPTRDRLFM
ncbi:hypothetical protein BFP46_22480 [Bacillus licheniformis]|nr:hypothetical protein BFP46_22480 [Bacillus licheniformis]